MKKYILTSLALFIVATFIVVTTAYAKQERPKGIEDRGPLEKITFIHYKKNHVKPDGVGGGKPKGKSSCYDFISKEAKWKTIEDFVVNASGSALAEIFVMDAVSNSVAEWETYGGDIFGSFSLDNFSSFDFDVMDGQNVLTFGSYSDPGVIGVTNVWGYFSGPPKFRELVEWDMLLNTYYSWGDGETDSSLMDLQNIITHELGHSAGMADIYDTTCDQETMYGYSTQGDIVKRDLNNGDIEGIIKLYN